MRYAGLRSAGAACGAAAVCCWCASAAAQTWTDARRTDPAGLYGNDRPVLLLDPSRGRVHYAYEEWDGGNWQIWTAELDLASGVWTPTQRTFGLNYSAKPAIVLDAARDVIHCAYQSAVGAGIWQIWTAELDLTTGVWTDQQRTATAFDKEYPDLVLDAANDKIYYVFQEFDGVSNCLIYTAELDLGTDTWTATQRTGLGAWCRYPHLVLDGAAGMLHYAYEYYDGGSEYYVYTATLDIGTDAWTATQRTGAGVWSRYPELVLDEASHTLHYAYQVSDPPRYQIATASMHTGGADWTATTRTSSAYDKQNPTLALDSAAGLVRYVYQQEDDAGYYQVATAELDPATDAWTAALPPWTDSAFPKEYPRFALDAANDCIHFVYQLQDNPGGWPSHYQVWTGKLSFPTPTPTATPTPPVTPTPTPAAGEGDLVIVGNGGTAGAPGSTMTVVDAASWSVARTLDISCGGETGWMPKDFIVRDGTLYVACNESHRLFYGPVSGPMEGWIDVGRYPLGVAALSRGGLAVVTCAGDDPWASGSGTLCAVDLAERRVIAQIPAGRMPNYGIAVEGGRVAVSALLDDAVRVFDEADGRALAVVGTGRHSLPLGLAGKRFGGAPYWAAALFGDGSSDAAAVFESGWGREIARVRLGEGVNGGGPVCVAASERLVAVCLLMGSRVLFYEIPSGRLSADVVVPEPGMGEFSPDGRHFYVPCFNGWLCRVDTADFSASAVRTGPNPVRARYCAAPAGGFPIPAERAPSPRSAAAAGDDSSFASFPESSPASFASFLGLR